MKDTTANTMSPGRPSVGQSHSRHLKRGRNARLRFRRGCARSRLSRADKDRDDCDSGDGEAIACIHDRDRY